ncbi:hypothetical protein GCM10027040_20920 [Halomonas shantousis]
MSSAEHSHHSDASQRPGLVATARHLLGPLLSPLLAQGETHLRLVTGELEAERNRLLTLLVLAGASLITLAFAIAMLLLLIVALFWDTHRLLAIGTCAAALLLCTLGLALGAGHVARKRRLMETTLNRLARGRRALEPSEPT